MLWAGKIGALKFLKISHRILSPGDHADRYPEHSFAYFGIVFMFFSSRPTCFDEARWVCLNMKMADHRQYDQFE